MPPLFLMETHQETLTMKEIFDMDAPLFLMETHPILRHSH